MSSPFTNRTSTGSGVYCRFANGKVCRPAQENETGAHKVACIDKEGNETGAYKWEHQSKEAVGHIVGMRVNIDGKFGPEFIVQMLHRESGTPFNIQMKVGDRYWRAITTTIENVNLDEEVTFIPYDYKRKSDGKQMTGVGIYQNGIARENQLQPKYTRENPGQMPPMGQKDKVGGGTTPDFTAQDNWLLKEVVLPLGLALQDRTPPVPTEDPDVPGDDGSDLPY